MSHFPDGTPYTYFSLDGGEAGRPVLNVGWLEPEHEFTIGGTGNEFRNKLAWQCANQEVNLTRGVFRCRLCRLDPGRYFIQAEAKESFLGAAEIRVEGQAATYASPNLILHYVVDHGYSPPDDFVAGVLRASEAYPDGTWRLRRRRDAASRRWWEFWIR